MDSVKNPESIDSRGGAIVVLHPIVTANSRLAILDGDAQVLVSKKLPSLVIVDISDEAVQLDIRSDPIVVMDTIVNQMEDAVRPTVVTLVVVVIDKCHKTSISGDDQG